MWWTAGSAKPPLPLSSTVFGIHSLFLPTGCQQTPKDSGYLVSRLQQSSQTHPSRMYVHRFSFRILSHLIGWTDHLRRTGRNPLRSDRFLRYGNAACQLNVTVGTSVHTMIGRLVPIVPASSPACSIPGSDLSGPNACPSRECEVFGLNLSKEP